MNKPRKLHDSKFGKIEIPLFNILQGNGITSLTMLKQHTLDELFALPGMGKVNCALMLDFLRRENIKLPEQHLAAATAPSAEKKSGKRGKRLTHIITTLCYSDGTQKQYRVSVTE